jgi:hypothetical protein
MVANAFLQMGEKNYGGGAGSLGEGRRVRNSLSVHAFDGIGTRSSHLA